MARRVLDIAPGCRVTARAERYEAARRGEFFPAQWDYIADCIDLVACKLDLIEAAQGGGHTHHLRPRDGEQARPFAIAA